MLLVQRGLAPSREKAKAMIMEGNVFVDQQREDKAGSFFDVEAKIEVRGNTLRYVSRGGLKLEKAMEAFGLDLSGCVCMDIGASTGGFTDCMLQNGAAKVYAVDVGYGQLAWKLRQDPRVVCMEKTNIRYVTPDQIGEPLDFASVDVSFISLTKVLEPAKALLKRGSADGMSDQAPVRGGEGQGREEGRCPGAEHPSGSNRKGYCLRAGAGLSGAASGLFPGQAGPREISSISCILPTTIYRKVRRRRTWRL